MQTSTESSFLGLKLKSGDKLLPRLNMDEKPIANKYCEGKMKRTLKREVTDLKPLKRKRYKNNYLLLVCVLFEGRLCPKHLIRRKV